MGPGIYFFHSVALPGIYLSPCMYLSPALIRINTVYKYNINTYVLIFVFGWILHLFQYTNGVNTSWTAQVFNTEYCIRANVGKELNWQIAMWSPTLDLSIFFYTIYKWWILAILLWNKYSRSSIIWISIIRTLNYPNAILNLKFLKTNTFSAKPSS